jgi:hypothetical protein
MHGSSLPPSEELGLVVGLVATAFGVALSELLAGLEGDVRDRFGG